MKLYIDTDNIESYKVVLTDEEKASVSKSANELTVGLSALAAEYIDQVFESEHYNTVRELIMKLFDVKLKDIIDSMLDGVSDEEIEELRSMMEQTGKFTDEEIDAIVDLVIDSGSIDSAMIHLRNLAKEKGIDIDSAMNAD